MKENNGTNGSAHYSIRGGTALSLLAIVAVAVMLVAAIMPSAALNDPVRMDITVDPSDGLSQDEITALKGDSDPVWEGATNTLHIYGTNFESTCAVALKSSGELTIDVNGTCRIVSLNTYQSEKSSFGIKANELTITGSGTLIVESGDVTDATTDGSESAGIRSDNGLTIAGEVTVTSTGGNITAASGVFIRTYSSGISAKDIVIDGAKVTGNNGIAKNHSGNDAFSSGIRAESSFTERNDANVTVNANIDGSVEGYTLVLSGLDTSTANINHSKLTVKSSGNVIVGDGLMIYSGIKVMDAITIDNKSDVTIDHKFPGI